ncbi:MAG: hypothetical protein EPO68_11250 [Planctomycetota bacterium]|nr:MAG: hypothetical protein EPO68_11250 [Planctomycetota bacterium]
MLGFLKLREAWLAHRVKSRLSASATADCFYRLTDSGETLFVNLVVSPHERPAFVTEIRAHLCRTGVTKKDMPLDLVRYGEPADRGNPINDHYFFSASPIDILQTGTAARRVLMMVISEYRTEMEQIARELQARAFALAGEARVAMNGDEQARKDVVEKIEACATEYTSKYMNKIQFDDGDYELEVLLKFRDVEGHGARELRECKTKVCLSVKGDFRALMQQQIRRLVESVIARLVNKDLDVEYPMFAPLVTRTVDSSDMERHSRPYG